MLVNCQFKVKLSNTNNYPKIDFLSLFVLYITCYILLNIEYIIYLHTLEILKIHGQKTDLFNIWMAIIIIDYCCNETGTGSVLAT